MDLVGLHRRVMTVSAEVVAGVAADDLDRPTPCAAWTLRDLLAHLIGQNHGFAVAVGGAGPDPTPFAPVPVDGEPAEVYAASVERVTTAFAACPPDRQVWLPEISTTRPYPVALALRFHLVDYVVHSWDVARSIGRTVEFDDDLLAAALAVAEIVPDDRTRLADGAFFRPALPVPDHASTLDRTLLLLGRDPAWTAA
jgi:uncharacterized protein (TIGR03086 family)